MVDPGKAIFSMKDLKFIFSVMLGAQSENPDMDGPTLFSKLESVATQLAEEDKLDKPRGLRISLDNEHFQALVCGGVVTLSCGTKIILKDIGYTNMISHILCAMDGVGTLRDYNE